MAMLSYGAIEGKIVHTRLNHREFVRTRDGQDVVFTKFTYDVDFVFNPQATSYKRVGIFGVTAPAAIAGETAWATEEAIRQYLSQPQRRLVYRRGVAGVPDSAVQVISPRDGYECDAKGGPFPEVLNIVQNLGDRTFIVSFRVTTYITEPRLSGGKKNMPVLLSHRWKRYVETDEHSMATVITEGEAIFNLGELIKRDTVPDQYRAELFHPLPVSMDRMPVTVVPHENGAGLHYRIVDKEAWVAISARLNRITRIEANQKTIVTNESPWSTILPAIPNAVFSGAMSGARGGIVGAGANILANVAGVALSGIVHSLPTATLICTAQVWGRKDANREALQRYALAICFGRIAGQTNFAKASTFIDIQHDLVRNYVQVTLTHTFRGATLDSLTTQIRDSGVRLSVPAIAGGIPGGPGAQGFEIAPAVAVATFSGQTTSFAGAGGNGAIAELIGLPGSRNASDQIVPPNQSGTRGTWLGRLFAQGLQTAGRLPTQPGALNVGNYDGEELAETL